jgi:hypothetical protein
LKELQEYQKLEEVSNTEELKENSSVNSKDIV